MPPRIFTDKTAKKLITQYKAGTNGVELARKYSVSSTVIYNELNRAGCSRRSARVVRIKCAVNEKAFNRLTKESLYWLGFLFADGCVTYERPTSPKLIINLSDKDKAQLVALRDFLGSEHKIGSSKVGNKYKRVHLSIRSPYLVKSLEKYGIVENKTTKGIPSKRLVNSRDFWRGVFDGDGHLGITKGRRVIPFAGLDGNKAVCRAFLKFLVSKDPYYKTREIRKRENSDVCYRITFASSKALFVTRLLYKDSSVYLDRKYKRYLDIEKHYA